MIYDKLPLFAFPQSPFGSGVAAAITQLANTIIRAIERDRKVREIEERLADAREEDRGWASETGCVGSTRARACSRRGHRGYKDRDDPRPHGVGQVTALASVFGVPTFYLVDRGEGTPLLDAETLDALSDETTREVTRECSRLPEREKRIVLGIVRDFGETT